MVKWQSLVEENPEKEYLAHYTRAYSEDMSRPYEGSGCSSGQISVAPRPKQIKISYKRTEGIFRAPYRYEGDGKA